MSTAASEGASQRHNQLVGAAIVIMAGILATTLSQPQVLGRIPIQNLLKNTLHVDRTANAAFFFWIGLPWYFKPFAGILTDAFPLFGSRRKNYILISTVLATLSWIGLFFTPIHYNALLWVVMGIDFFMVIVSTVVGAYMVEVAQANAGSGRLTALREIVEYASIMVAGPLGGILAAMAFGVTIGLSGAIMFVLVPAAYFFMHERRQRVDTHELLHNARQQLVRIGTARTMWGATGLMALFYIAPGLSTAIFYRQQNLLHMTTQGQGWLQFLAGGFSVAAAFLYGYCCKRINLRNLLLIGIALSAVASLGYVLYTSVNHARVIDSFSGFAGTLAECALMDLAVRATPAGSEGLGYSLMLSVRNLALFGTDAIGSSLLDHYHFQFNSLVFANAATTLLVVPLIFWLPRAMVFKKDAEPMDDPALPKTAVQQ